MFSIGRAQKERLTLLLMYPSLVPPLVALFGDFFPSFPKSPTTTDVLHTRTVDVQSQRPFRHLKLRQKKKKPPTTTTAWYAKVKKTTMYNYFLRGERMIFTKMQYCYI